MDSCRLVTVTGVALGRNNTIAYRVNPEAGEPVVVRIAADFGQFAIPNLEDIKMFGRPHHKMFPVRMRQDMNRSIIQQDTVNDP